MHIIIFKHFLHAVTEPEFVKSNKQNYFWIEKSFEDEETTVGWTYSSLVFGSQHWTNMLKKPWSVLADTIISILTIII